MWPTVRFMLFMLFMLLSAKTARKHNVFSPSKRRALGKRASCIVALARCASTTAGTERKRQ